MRRNFERFCYKNYNKGIPNLMLYISLGTAVVYLMTMVTGNPVLYGFLNFDRTLILHGQIWRLFTYPLTSFQPIFLLMAVMLLCYYSLGRMMENRWGTFKFNLFYLTGVVLMDIYSLIFNCRADVSYLNLSLLLSYATMYPDASFLLFFIIPIKAWFLALFDLGTILLGLLSDPFPYNLFPIIALANYFLFFGSEVLNLVPRSWQIRIRGFFHKGPKKQKGPAKVIPFSAPSGSPAAAPGKAQVPYTHKCTVCGRTDVSNPELEFRYCSKCNGYYCYCEDHINNHEHIQ